MFPILGWKQKWCLSQWLVLHGTIEDISCSRLDIYSELTWWKRSCNIINFGVTSLLEGSIPPVGYYQGLPWIYPYYQMELFGYWFCLRAVWNISGISEPADLLQADKHFSVFSMQSLQTNRIVTKYLADHWFNHLDTTTNTWAWKYVPGWGRTKALLDFSLLDIFSFCGITLDGMGK